MSIATEPNANQEYATEREGLCLPKGSGATPGLGRGWLQPVVPVRDIWLFGEVVCMMNWIVLGTAVGVPQRDFLKGELKHEEQGPCALLLSP